MNELFLHYIWQQKLFMICEQITTDGLPIQVIDVGRKNTDAGADFFNAKIKIGETMWVGNVEIHIKASDWERHGHQNDKAYNNVILHVVAKSDKDVFGQSGDKIPQCELAYPPYIEAKYEQLCQTKHTIPCSDKLHEVPSIFISTWKDYLLTERFEQKTIAIENLLQQNKNHWEEAFYVTLARNFGFHTNSLAFEMLAKSLPLNYLGKHKDDLFQIEALLFGQSGLLEKANNEYACKLKKEYNFLRQKFTLQPIDASLWKLLRLRPDNFPHVRIAEFAALIHASNKLFSKIITNPTYEELAKLFDVRTSSYWDTHYLFGESSRQKRKKLGKNSIDIVLINTVIPFIFAYAKKHDNSVLQEKAFSLLSEIASEKNAIILKWKELGQGIENAYDSQAYLQLTTCYCDDKRCLQCRIGNKILQIKP